MSNTKKIEDDDLMHCLSRVFKEYGYEGASLTIISQASGLKKPSLYHRFPRGKEQMAEEVLAFTYRWIEKNILELLESNDTPEKKIKLFASQIGKLYNNGKESCLLNMLSSTKSEDNPFAKAICSTFKTLQKALSDIAHDAGFEKKEAQVRAENVLVALQGALVLSRGIGDTAPFERMQERLPAILLH